MKVKAIAKLPRWTTIPGAISKADYRALQAGEVVGLPDDTANYLIEKDLSISVSRETSKDDSHKPLNSPANTKTVDDED